MHGRITHKARPESSCGPAQSPSPACTRAPHKHACDQRAHGTSPNGSGNADHTAHLSLCDKVWGPDGVGRVPPASILSFCLYTICSAFAPAHGPRGFSPRARGGGGRRQEGEGPDASGFQGAPREAVTLRTRRWRPALLGWAGGAHHPTCCARAGRRPPAGPGLAEASPPPCPAPNPSHARARPTGVLPPPRRTRR